MIDKVKDIFIRYRILLASCAALLAVVTLVSSNAMADATVEQSGRLLTIHDQGTEKVLVTKARTVGDALKKAHVSLDNLDSVEPAINTELIANNYNINVYRARPVTVIDGEVQVRVMTAHQSARQIAKDAKLKLYDEDKTEIGRVDDIVNSGVGLKLTIDRATPFTLKLYGKKIAARTQASTIAAMLKEKKITLGQKDNISIKSGALLKKGMTVEIWREGKQTINEDQKIDFAVEQIQDADREVGYRDVKTPGTPGEKTVTYEIVMKNGKEVSRKEIQSVVTKQPQKQVEIVGAKPTFSGSFADALVKLRTCEAGGNYANKNNPMYRGAYQYSYSTWANYKGYYDPADAPAAVQDERAWQTYQARGWQPWPNCGASLPDTYR